MKQENVAAIVNTHIPYLHLHFYKHRLSVDVQQLYL